MANKFYYGVNSLADKDDIAIALTNPSGLAVRKDNKIALGGDTGTVITKVIADDYAAEVDITDSHPASAINALAWVNGDTT